MRIAMVMDPIEHVSIEKDTSFAFLLAAQKRGHELLYLSQRDLWVSDGRLRARVRPLTVQRAKPPAHASIGDVREVWLDEVDALFERTDPPFNAQYAYATQLYELLRGKTLVVNDPQGLRNANEKLYALHFPEVTPQTIVTWNAEHIRDFVTLVGGRAVIKPLDGNGGRGVFILDRGDLNFNAIIESATGEGKLPVMVQTFLPEVRKGDKRVLLLNGELLGAILRVPRDDEARSNIHVGGTVQPTELTPRERSIVDHIAPRLRADGLYFVGLDVIGEKLTEVNVTSPTGIQELSRHKGEDVAERVIAWTEERVRAMKR